MTLWTPRSAASVCPLRSPSVNPPTEPSPAPTSAEVPDHAHSGSKPKTWQKLRSLGPAGILAAFAGTIPGMTGVTLLASVSSLGPWLREQGAYAVFFLVLAYWAVGGAMLLPTYGYSATCGWAFGPLIGGIAALSGIVGASLINYLWARAVCKDRVVKLLDSDPRSRAVYHALLGGSRLKTLGIVCLMRFPPFAPFALTNVLLAATRVPPGIVFLGTLLGMMPRSLIVVVAASKMANLSETEKTHPAVFIGGIAVTVAVLWILGVLSNRALTNATRTATPLPATPQPAN